MQMVDYKSEWEEMVINNDKCPQNIKIELWLYCARSNIAAQPDK